MAKDIIRLSYERHSTRESQMDMPIIYTRPDSIDTWQHERKLKTVLPFIKLFPGASWMTIGDGRYGSDAYFLKKNGADVLATSITDANLKIACERKFIDKYQCVNAEDIPFPDQCFDFVLCKESYHHFPRPPIAFYEMLRVAKKGIILIEPIDDSAKPLEFVKRFAKLLIRKNKIENFEPSGNYIFRVNINEIKKMAIALNLHLVAIKKYNHFFNLKISTRVYKKFSIPTLYTHLGIFVQDLLSFTWMINFGMATVIVFKETISSVVKSQLISEGYQIYNLPKNPYLE